MFGTTQNGKSDYAYGTGGGLSSNMLGKPKILGSADTPKIRVKQEWTVMSNAAENRSDVELRSFEQRIAGSESPKRVVLQPNGHLEWSSEEEDLPGKAISHDSRGSNMF